MFRKNPSPPTSPVNIMTNTDKHTSAIPIKIVSRNTVLKTTNTTKPQYVNVMDENKEGIDWITVKTKSPNAYKDYNLLQAYL